MCYFCYLDWFQTCYLFNYKWLKPIFHILCNIVLFGWTWLDQTYKMRNKSLTIMTRIQTHVAVAVSEHLFLPSTAFAVSVFLSRFCGPPRAKKWKFWAIRSMSSSPNSLKQCRHFWEAIAGARHAGCCQPTKPPVILFRKPVKARAVAEMRAVISRTQIMIFSPPNFHSSAAAIMFWEQPLLPSSWFGFSSPSSPRLTAAQILFYFSCDDY